MKNKMTTQKKNKTVPHKPRALNAFDWYFNHSDIITVTDYFLHNEGAIISTDDIDNAYGFSEYYQKENLLKHLATCDVITKTKGGWKLKKSSESTKALKKLKEYLQAKMGDR